MISDVRSQENYGKFWKTGVKNWSICKSQKGMEPGVRKGNWSLLVCRSRCKYSVETIRNSVKFKLAPLSKTGYWLGVCHGWFHLHGLTRPARSANRKLQNEKFLPIVGFEPATFRIRSEVAKRCESQCGHEFFILWFSVCAPHRSSKLMQMKSSMTHT